MSSSEKAKALTLFGSDLGWDPKDWTASDDRVRGGKSQSYLDVVGENAHFHGTLDIKTLGGAGFASQRTTGDDRVWDLSKYAGIQLNFAKGDKKRYTLTIKDELLPPNPENGREQSTISWEIDFELPPQTEPGETHGRSIFVPWSALNPTYRGKVQKDVDPLKVGKIRRISLMMRSFFGTQEGDFSLYVRSIKALASAPEPSGMQATAPHDAIVRMEKGLHGPTNDPVPHRTLSRIPYAKIAASVLLAGLLTFQIARWLTAA